MSDASGAGTAAIRVLPDALAARIAAGEVIERPASVVKELVENSLDAGASRVHVEVEDGGRSLIRVADDGHGIAAGEVGLAFERFATSKIDDSSDLVGIATLGFRGEALPSIASVSVVEVVTRTGSTDAAVRLLVEFGDVKPGAAAAAPRGTAIAVRDLFRNVPARLKFLASAGAELGRIQQVVTAYALVRPAVSFRLVADGSQRLATAGRGDLVDAVGGIYGARVADALLELRGTGSPPPEGPGGGFDLHGFVCGPAVSRGNRNYITLSVNGRWIQSRRLTFAVEQAFHGFLPDRRFPVAVIHLGVPAGDVDVNVHPAKTEVRFLREQLLFASLQRTVRSTLLEFSPVPATAATGGRPAAAGRFSRPAAGSLPNPLWPLPAGLRAGGEPGTRRDISPDSGRGAAPGDDAGRDARPTPRRAIPVLRVIGQAQDTYIIAEGPEGVYLIDQHAAHERVLFEEIGRRMAENAPESQQLLAAESVELQPRQQETLAEHADLLAAVGYAIEPFGDGAVLVRAVPRIVGGEAASQALLALLDSLAEGGSADQWRERAVASLACHGSVTAGRRMSVEEGRELVRRLEETEQPHTCPHGRPTMVHLSASSLEREFGRR